MHAKHCPIFLAILALVVKDETDRGWSFCEPSLVSLPALGASVRFTSVIFWAIMATSSKNQQQANKNRTAQKWKRSNGQSAVHKHAKSRQLHSRIACKFHRKPPRKLDEFSFPATVDLALGLTCMTFSSAFSRVYNRYGSTPKHWLSWKMVNV